MLKMRTLFNLLIAFMLLVSPAYAGENMKAGEKLSEDSYVFSIPEATNLMNRLSELEQEVERQKLIIDEYKILDQIQQQKAFNFVDLLETKELQISEYEKLHTLDTNRIKQLNRQVNASKFEKWAFMGVGIGITVGAILVADKIDDGIESIGDNKAQQSGVTLLRF